MFEQSGKVLVNGVHVLQACGVDRDQEQLWRRRKLAQSEDTQGRGAKWENTGKCGEVTLVVFPLGLNTTRFHDNDFADFLCHTCSKEMLVFCIFSAGSRF